MSDGASQAAERQDEERQKKEQLREKEDMAQFAEFLCQIKPDSKEYKELCFIRKNYRKILRNKRLIELLCT